VVVEVYTATHAADFSRRGACITALPADEPYPPPPITRVPHRIASASASASAAAAVGDKKKIIEDREMN